MNDEAGLAEAHMGRLEGQLGKLGLMRFLKSLSDGDSNNWRLSRLFDVSILVICLLRKNLEVALSWTLKNQVNHQEEHEEDHSQNLRLLYYNRRRVG